MKQQRTNPVLLVSFLLVASAVSLASGAVLGAGLSGDALIDELSRGGYVIVMRHASAEREPPPPQRRASGNTAGERQLTEDGRNLMIGMRSSFRRLGVRIGDTYSSPTFRAVETARHLGHGYAGLQRVDALGADGADPAWLSEQANTAPAEGRNTLIITHARNAVEAFGEEAAGLQEGESLIYRPGAEGGAELVARVAVGEWALLGRE